MDYNLKWDLYLTEAEKPTKIAKPHTRHHNTQNQPKTTPPPQTNNQPKNQYLTQFTSENKMAIQRNEFKSID